MCTDLPIHPTQRLTTAAGENVDIDVEMVPVIRPLWRLGFTTTACCQDVGEATAALRAARKAPSRYGGDGFIAFHRGYSLLKMPVPDAQRFVTLLLETDAFHERVRYRWRAGSWRMNVPFACETGTVTLAPAALLHFPRVQLGELIQVLKLLAG